jgi:hypothetical protein
MVAVNFMHCPRYPVDTRLGEFQSLSKHAKALTPIESERADRQVHAVKQSTSNFKETLLLSANYLYAAQHCYYLAP